MSVPPPPGPARLVVRDSSAPAPWWVVVDGRGPVPQGLVARLRQLGIARVDGGGYAADAAEAACDRVPGTGAQGAPDLVVLIAAGAVPPAGGRPWVARGIPHLPIATENGAATLGPLVLPGVSACLGCLDLVRADVDPGWAAVAARAHAAPLLSPAPADAGPRLTPLVVDLAALVVMGWVEGAAPMLGVSAEVALPWPTVVHRHWPAHPGCRCGAPMGRTPVAGPSGGLQHAHDTMAR